mmetsp:Transcript_39739/g.100117  ORF Transcript_39739/g.100117 Transcript_39739/m.100117 type:complete len:264 (+) Transcript_39739:198-989(+)
MDTLRYYAHRLSPSSLSEDSQFQLSVAVSAFLTLLLMLFKISETPKGIVVLLFISLGNALWLLYFQDKKFQIFDPQAQLTQVQFKGYPPLKSVEFKREDGTIISFVEMSLWCPSTFFTYLLCYFSPVIVLVELLTMHENNLKVIMSTICCWILNAFVMQTLLEKFNQFTKGREIIFKEAYRKEVETTSSLVSSARVPIALLCRPQMRSATPPPPTPLNEDASSDAHAALPHRGAADAAAAARRRASVSPQRMPNLFQRRNTHL